VDEDDQIVLAAVGDRVVERGLAEDDRLDVGDLQLRTLIRPDCRL
jgi:hypothetical protein